MGKDIKVIKLRLSVMQKEIKIKSVGGKRICTIGNLIPKLY